MHDGKIQSAKPSRLHGAWKVARMASAFPVVPDRAKLKDEEGDVQVSTLIYSMGPEAETVFNTFKFNADTDKTNLDIAVKLYDDYFTPQKNVIHERAMFYTRNQKQGETAELFYEMAKKCGFGDQKEDHIRNRIVTSLSGKELSCELQLKNLNTAVQLVKQREIVKSQLMAQGQSQASALEEVRHPVGRMNKENRSRTMITGAVSVITNMRDDLAPRKENCVVSVGN